MKIKRHEIREPITVEVSGTEPWLDDIYEMFAVPVGEAKPLIEARLVVSVVSSDYVRVKGRVDYRPWLACSRCADMIQWDVNAAVDAIYQPEREGVADKREHSLSRAELDEYYFQNDMIDLEVLINDAIHMEIPEQVVPCDESGDKCLKCGKDLTSECVYGANEDIRENPFAALRDLGKKTPKTK